MLHLVENLQFKADIPFVTQDSPCFKSLSYPPKDEFVMSINHDGEVVSRFGDDTWDFTPFFSSQKLQFKEYDESNKALFKQLMYYLIYSHLFPGKYSSLGSWYKSYQNIFRACSKAEIKASELSRFPIIIEEMAESYAKRSPSNYSKSIWHYDVILKNQDQVGFTLLSERGIAIYKKIDSRYDYGQTPYIPHSIWTNLIKYLDSVLDDFELYQDKLEKVYHYIAHTSLLNESNGIPSRYSSPFSRGRMHGKKYYPGTFEEYLNTTDVMALIEKYSERSKSDKFKTYRVDQFGAILNLSLIHI